MSIQAVACLLVLQVSDTLPTVENFLDQDPPRVQQQEEKGFLEEMGDTLWTVGKPLVLDMGYLATAPLRPTTEGVLTFVGGVALIGVTMGGCSTSRSEDSP